MKSYALAIAILLSACTSAKNHHPSLNTDDEKMSYAMGYMTGKMFQGLIQEQELDNDQFFIALRETAELREGELLMNEEEIEKYTKMHEQKLASIKENNLRDQALKNAETGLEFRQENGEKETVYTLESGIQYEKIISNSDGTKPTLEDSVVAHYQGSLPDGTVFDSSIQRGEPATFPLRRVIKGWQETIPMMKTGEKWRIVLPPEVAYGEQGHGAIGPNQTLIFEIEVIEIK